MLLKKKDNGRIVKCKASLLPDKASLLPDFKNYHLYCFNVLAIINQYFGCILECDVAIETSQILPLELDEHTHVYKREEIYFIRYSLVG